MDRAIERAKRLEVPKGIVVEIPLDLLLVEEDLLLAELVSGLLELCVEQGVHFELISLQFTVVDAILVG